MSQLLIPGHILVVDDDEEDHDIMRSACEVLGADEALKFFHDGHALLKYLRSSHVKSFESPEAAILGAKKRLLSTAPHAVFGDSSSG